jgi:hypothetical protein
MSWLLQYTFDDPVFERLLRTVSQTGNVISVGDFGGTGMRDAWNGPGGAFGHGLAVGDSVALKGCGAGIDGIYDVATTPSNTSYTVVSPISQNVVVPPSSGARVTPLRVWVHPLAGAVTAPRFFTTIGIGQPPTVSPTIVTGVRARITSWTSGNLDFAVLHAGMGT